MTSNKSGEHICKSGAVFHWKRDEVPGHAGVLSGYFSTQASGADVREVQEYLRSLIPENGTVAYSGVFDGPTKLAAQQRAAAMSDQLLGRASRN